MRFSLRMITSGALSSISFLRRLLRLITRRYRSLRSDVAKRPPSSGTSGRSSGGITGITSRIIHSGRFVERWNESTTLSRLASFSVFCADVSARIWVRRSTASFSMSTRLSSSLIASAPMRARNLGPYSSRALRYCSSVSNWFGFSSPSPGEITT